MSEGKWLPARRGLAIVATYMAAFWLGFAAMKSEGFGDIIGPPVIALSVCSMVGIVILSLRRDA